MLLIPVSFTSWRHYLLRCGTVSWPEVCPSRSRSGGSVWGRVWEVGGIIECSNWWPWFPGSTWSFCVCVWVCQCVSVSVCFTSTWVISLWRRICSKTTATHPTLSKPVSDQTSLLCFVDLCLHNPLFLITFMEFSLELIRFSHYFIYCLSWFISPHCKNWCLRSKQYLT